MRVHMCVCACVGGQGEGGGEITNYLVGTGVQKVTLLPELYNVHGRGRNVVPGPGELHGGGGGARGPQSGLPLIRLVLSTRTD